MCRMDTHVVGASDMVDATWLMRHEIRDMVHPT